jgi:hypothetical protein
MDWARAQARLGMDWAHARAGWAQAGHRLGTGALGTDGLCPNVTGTINILYINSLGLCVCLNLSILTR